MFTNLYPLEVLGQETEVSQQKPHHEGGGLEQVSFHGSGGLVNFTEPKTAEREEHTIHAKAGG